MFHHHFKLSTIIFYASFPMGKKICSFSNFLSVEGTSQEPFYTHFASQQSSYQHFALCICGLFSTPTVSTLHKVSLAFPVFL